MTLLRSAIAFFLVAAALAAQVKYPETKTVDQKDTTHGQVIADPYRWLEDDVRTSKDVAAWVEAQNAVTFAWLSDIPARKKIAERLKELWNYERTGTPTRVGDRFVYAKNDGLQNQAVLWITDDLAKPGEVLLDPNGWTKDGTAALAGQTFSESGKYLVYAVADAGSDWRTLKVMDVRTKKDLADEIRWVKFSSIAFTQDERGFFYARFEKPEEGAAFQSLNLNQKVWYHALGTAQADDVLVYFRPENPDWNYSPEVTEDGRYLVMTVSKDAGTRRGVLVRDLLEPYAMPIEVTPRFESMFDCVGNDGKTLYFRTDRGAPRGKVVAIDLADVREERWKTIVPESENAMTGASMVGNRFVVNYLRNAASEVQVYGTDGALKKTVALPGIGTAAGFDGARGSDSTFYTFSSYQTPPTVYRLDAATAESAPVFTPKFKADLSGYVVEQVFYASKDGTKIPMFLTHKKDMKKDGRNPTLLYGYGGFNIPQTPAFSASRVAWLEMGGVLAVANLRGGGEFGDAWHRAGTKLQKQNVFDDFIAAAEWLIQNEWTKPEKLAIQGGSNGGLLVGACMTQRPDLFGACLPAVGVMDMLRFEFFTAGRFWTDDYGSVKNADEFRALAAYSPYHNLKDGVKYPATLVTTGDHDDRVVPGHSFKFAARLQKAQGGSAPCLIRIETRAGHGAGKPTSKVIEEVADQMAFLVRSLKLEEN